MSRPFFAFIQRHKQLLPLLLLAGFCISAIVTASRGTVILTGITYGTALTMKHYVAFCTVALNVLVYFFFRKYYRYTLTLTILAGLFNFMIFPLRNISVGVEVNSLKIAVQPSALYAGLLVCALNIKRIYRALRGSPKSFSRYRK